MKYTILKNGSFRRSNTDTPYGAELVLEQWLKRAAVKYGIAYNDPCCNDPAQLPISINANGEIQSFNPDTGVWSDATLAFDGGIANRDQSMLAAFYPQVAQNNIVAGAGGAIAVTNYLTTINTDAVGDAFTLADGTIVGQMKKILLVADGGGNAVITPANLAAGTTITMNDAADYVILQWNGTDWVVLENSGSTIA